MVVLHALGQCVIRTSVATITPRADIGFALATRLIAERGKRVSRQSLLALFWPASPASSAAHALSEALHKLRRKGLPVRADDTNCVWIARESVCTDIEHLATEAPHALVDRDLTILPGYSPSVSAGFEDWLDDWRAELRQRLVAGLAHATERAEDEGDGRTVMRLAEQLLKLDPGNEAALAATASAVESLRRDKGQRRRSPRSPADDGRDRAPILGSPVSVGGSNRLALPGAADVQRVSELTARGGWAFPAGGFPAARDTTLVGRDADIAFAAEVLDAASLGKGGGAYISGAAGVGKSRFVRALTIIARKRQMAVASIACQQADIIRPLSVFVDIVPQLRLLPGAAGAMPAMAPYLDRLTTHGPNDYMPNGGGQEIEHSYSCVQHAVFDLLEAISDEQPLVLVVENMQWLDKASPTLLREMSSWATTRPVAFVFTSRDRWNTEHWGAPPEALKLHYLLPLIAEAALAHATEYAKLIGQLPPAVLLEWCISASEGNPYLLEELLNHWAATGEQFATPRSLTALLNARLDRLTPAALRVLQTCAVMGKNSTLARIERLLKHPPHELFGALEELGTAGMLTMERDTDSTGKNRVLCRHAVLAQTVIDRVSPAGLEILHRWAGEVLELELDSPSSASLLWDCASHWHASSNSTRAVELGRSCIGHLLEVGLADDAADGCKHTLNFCTRDEDKLDILNTLAHVLHLTRSWSEMLVVVDDVRSHQIAIGLTESFHDDLELLRFEAEWHAFRDWDVTLQSVQRCVMADKAEPTHRVRAGIIALKLATNLGRDVTMHSMHVALQAVLYAPSVSPVDRLTFEMIFHAICGSASLCVRTAEELLRSLDDDIPELQRLCISVNCGSALFRAGAIAEAEATFGSAMVRSQELGASALALETCTKVAMTYLDTNDLTAAEIWTRKALALSADAPHLSANRFLRFALARIELHKEHVTAADHLLYNDGQPLWEDPVDLFRSAALAAKIGVELSTGDRNSLVRTFVEQLAPLSKRLRSMGYQDFETFSLYRGMCALGMSDEADSLLVRYTKHERRDPLPLSKEIATQIDRIQRVSTD